MRTFTIEEGEFVTDGRVDKDGVVIGELTNYRGTRRWAVRAKDIGLGAEAEVVAPVVAFALEVAPPVAEAVAPEDLVSAISAVQAYPFGPRSEDEAVMAAHEVDDNGLLTGGPRTPGEWKDWNDEFAKGHIGRFGVKPQ
jgi:hypothetical protein